MPTQAIAITTGEPAGIGPDITIMVAQQGQSVPLVAIGDPQLLEQRARQLNLPLAIRLYDPGENPGESLQPTLPGELYVQPVALRENCIAGELSPANAAYVLETLDVAAAGCSTGHFASMVTAPVHKGVINDAGIPFSGHTEYLAELTGTPRVVMMLATKGLRVALATTHLPLADVSAAISAQLLEEVITILHGDLVEKFAIADPRILVCGLNPHAGEGGHLGREEIEVIEPTLAQLRERGIRLEGPLPADTLFTPKYLDHADAVLAMYHDQGLPVLKYAGFGQAVNITLGLPIVRTSVDHGTALDIAGTGSANPASLRVAIEYAQSLAAR